MYKSRFQDQVPHHQDTQLLERCQECIRDYDIYYKGWVEPKDHTMSYLAAAFIELAKKYDDITKTTAFEAQMNTLESEINAEGLALVEELNLDES